MQPKTIKVTAIKNGTVIDHIPAGQGVNILSHLKIAKNKIVMLGVNLKSKHLGKKDLIKIEDKELEPLEIDQLAIFAPEATVNIIRDFELSKKFNVKLPDTFQNTIKCPNPNCITNQEETDTKFQTVQNKPLKVKCAYCEKIFKQEEIVLK
ncbi:MAG: aspartate carbamoyltransferase regulatory subunit [Patescibacteria group bacterium]